MKYIKKCPHCGGEVTEKTVTEVVYGGVHTAFLTVRAGVCHRCGERLYTPDTIRQFEKIESQLECQEIADFQPVGKSFQIVLSA
ncbi:YgiT-type zinc finger protein [Desulfonema magnum]|uniref:Zinc finger domain-containing protein, MqsA-type n=1 Tax=Desulfonema magnum TaxID=45655 RepID=A0A975BIX2_9BACT|nr:YgiT-type zinc finger protein [Desulfonema magnum]QTA86150.1 Zinc finger domain-containing protein, MqsA-type [Desulfonema magnum]